MGKALASPSSSYFPSYVPAGKAKSILDTMHNKTSSNQDPSRRNKKRRRTTLSCVTCHQRKVKCDRKLPCSSCISYGTGDVCSFYLDSVRRQMSPTDSSIEEDESSYQNEERKSSFGINLDSFSSMSGEDTSLQQNCLATNTWNNTPSYHANANQLMMSLYHDNTGQASTSISDDSLFDFSYIPTETSTSFASPQDLSLGLFNDPMMTTGLPATVSSSFFTPTSLATILSTMMDKFSSSMVSLTPSTNTIDHPLHNSYFPGQQQLEQARLQPPPPAPPLAFQIQPPRVDSFEDEMQSWFSTLQQYS